MDANQTLPGVGGPPLLDYFTAIKNQIIDLATQKGISPSGKTLSSLQVEQTPTGYQLTANSSIYFIENGRGPTPPGTPAGNPTLAQVIADWIDAKGLSLNPYAVANTIHKSGTKLYRSGGNSGILSVPLNLDTLDEVFSNISAQYLKNTADMVFEPLDSIK
jgi:hypothetical protein